MSKENQKALPEFRFPEFKNDGDWIESTLNEVAKYENGKAHEKEISETGVYKVVNSKFISTDGEIVKYTDSANLKANVGDILMVLSDIPNGKAIAKCFYVDKDNTYTVNQRICKITPTKINNRFLYYIQNRNPYFLAFDDGVKQTNLRKDTVLSFPFLRPLELKEQEKIADCISSLDTLINLEVQKLEKLNDHKKGLLQQLFPIEGKTKPKFRFPEFENDGDWTITSLNKISTSIFDGTHQTPKYKDKGVPFFSVENIVSGRKNKFISREDYLYETRNNKPEFEDVLITRIGNIGTPKVVDWEYEFSIYVTLAVVKKSKKFDPYYLQAYIQSSRFQKEILRRSLLKAAPCKINMDELRKCEVLLPSDKKEQQKIAKCISSADELIESQTQKIKTLKKHKKGLMQQLFPNVNNL